MIEIRTIVSAIYPEYLDLDEYHWGNGEPSRESGGATVVLQKNGSHWWKMAAEGETFRAICVQSESESCKNLVFFNLEELQHNHCVSLFYKGPWGSLAKYAIL